MITNFSPHGTTIDMYHPWKFYTTKFGNPVGNCGETEGAAITAEGNEKPRVGADGKTPFPGGIFKLNIEGEACTHKCDGNNAERLFCPQREIACREDPKKNGAVGAIKCVANQFFATSVYCDF